MAKRKIAERIDGELTVEASTPCPKIDDLRRDPGAAHDRGAVRSLVLSITDFPPMKAPPPRAAAVPSADERRRLERDLHDGVQNQLVALVVTALAQKDGGIPPALAETVAGLEANAQAARAPLDASLEGAAPCGIEEAHAGLRNIRERVKALDGAPDILQEMSGGLGCGLLLIARSRDG